MDEKNHIQVKPDSHRSHHADDELENWTFVNTEDSVAVGKIEGGEVNQEDLSDNGSEQGSDSGSSIVVIDTTYSSYSRDNSRNVDLSLPFQDCNDNLKEPESTCSSEQAAEEFTKENSPFFLVGGSPSLWVTQECSQHSVTECLASAYHEEPEEGKRGINAGEAVNIIADEFSCNDSPQHANSQNDDRVEALVDIQQQPERETNDTAAVEDFSMDQEKEAGACGLEEKNLDTDSIQDTERNQTIEDEQEMPRLLASISSADDLDEAIKFDEHELLNNAEGEESDEENWDLGVEALALSASLASSVSSLAGQPDSPSPIVGRGQNPSTNLVKPDLLEEANRIEELDQYDYSSVTNPDLPPELNVGAILRERAYVHRPNQRLNVQLSYIVAFVLAAVFGFALGNLIGLADNFPSRCNTLKAQAKTAHLINEKQWRAEVQRLAVLNEELKQAAERSADELHELASQNSQFDLRINELITENWDLKQSIGRIRYGKPVRSIEDRHTINILQTENQELRSMVGKLRYKCGQEYSLAEQKAPDDKMDETILDESQVPIWIDSLLKLLGAMNRTSDLNKFVGNNQEVFSFEKLSILQDAAANLVELISLRRDELANMTKEKSLRSAEKMKASLHKASSKVLSVLERLQNHHTSWDAVIDEEQTQVDKIRAKMENRWEKFLNRNGCSNETCPVEMKRDSFVREFSNSVAETSEGFRTNTNQGRWSLEKKMELHDNNFSKDRESSIDPEWFLVMGRKREKIRRDEEKSEWLFERAKNRDQERRSRKYRKEKKAKVSKDGAWKQYAA